MMEAHKEFEYYLATVDIGKIKAFFFKKELNKLGSKGWELCCMSQRLEGLVMVFKRQIIT
jgi:hypothetical protein